MVVTCLRSQKASWTKPWLLKEQLDCQFKPVCLQSGVKFKKLQIVAAEVRNGRPDSAANLI